MYDLTPEKEVDITEEIAAVARYTASRWEVPFDINELVKRVAKCAMYDARFWFDLLSVQKAVGEKIARRAEVLSVFDKSGLGLLRHYDVSCTRLVKISLTLDLLRKAGRMPNGQRWDFSRSAGAAHSLMTDIFPNLTGAKPLGFDSLMQNYSDFLGQEEYCKTEWKQDVDAFQGANTEARAAAAYPNRIALPYVAYDVQCQGRSAPYLLVSSIYGHFLGIAEHINTQKALADFKALNFKVEESAPLWELDVHSTNPILNAVLQFVARDEHQSPLQVCEAYDEAVTNALAFQRLSEAEQAAQRKEQIQDLMSDVRDPKKQAEAAAKHQADLDYCKEMLATPTTPAVPVVRRLRP